tara:strand:+ start:434 stop:1159 length:726 start_codon:yes stop_codon:yes gene_type:complete
MSLAITLLPDDLTEDEDLLAKDDEPQLSLHENPIVGETSAPDSSVYLESLLSNDEQLMSGGTSEGLITHSADMEGNDSDETEVEINLQLSNDDLTNLPSPLKDWTKEDDLMVVELGQDQTLTISVPDDVLGSLVILDADYIELGNNSGSDIVTEHTGANIYFVPDGETFPENYQWSSEGGTLVDIGDYQNNEADFGGIKLVGRIDSGSWTVEHQINEGSIIIGDSRIGDPEILSELVINYI